ncbi:hypothetical protein HOLleu_12133 [Holothuria leucospilota]|uniref:B box-type domain-containing protein n=1 Tax=Holothuria leucospilota TaxID=206669 RepID=A0A9Q1HCS1_HOLLE|nr:hypothetical protein HOLleu_12133 [Holothuria leucospilota]
MEKLASMRDAPRCGTHREKLSELYCETCINLPICMACMLDEHKGRNLHEAKALAKLKKEELSQKLKAIEEMKKSSKVITPVQAKQTLTLNVSIEKERVVKMHDEKDQKIMKKIQDTENRKQQLKREKENSEKIIFDSLQTEMENEIQEVKKNYERIFKAKKIELANTLQARQSSLEKELAELWEKRKPLGEDKKKYWNQ